MPIPAEIQDFLSLEDLEPRHRATRIYELLRAFLAIPVDLRTATLNRLTQELLEHPERESIFRTLADFWSHHSYVRVISEAGLPEQVFLVRELLARAGRRLLPVDEVGGDLYVLLDSLHLREADARWIGTVPAELVKVWSPVFRPARSSILASCKVLALRAAHIALSRDLLQFAGDEDITRSGFFHLSSIAENAALRPESLGEWDQARASCETQLDAVNRRLAETGSSADLVFRIRMLRSLLARIHQVVSLGQPEPMPSPGSGTDHLALLNGRRLTISIVHGFAAQRQIFSVLGASTHRLARSMVEKTGRAGMHYIAGSAAQWRVMGMGAILAGGITAFTALLKYVLSGWIHAPMLLALAYSLNYVISFLGMQAGGFLLASKMPAATAAALVDAMEDPGTDHMNSLKAISRTQVIVTLGNLAGAVPASILVDRVFALVTGHPFLNPEQANHGVTMVIPHQSATIVFAMVTGVFLWLSSLATGWTANYIALHNLPSAIGNSLRIRARLGERGGNRLAEWVQHHAAGTVGFVVLGFLLGTGPILFELFGIPLEVRHVTLAAASLGYALDAEWIGHHLVPMEALSAFVGIAMIGVLNIVTSFALSFLLAVRARSIGPEKSRHFLRQVVRELVVSPLDFLLPVRPGS